MKDLKELEGTKFTWRFDLREEEAILAMAEYDLGFTITLADDLDYELTCFHGKHSKTPKKYKGKENYDAEVTATFEMIKSDTYNVNKCPWYKVSDNCDGSNLVCAFK